MDRIPFPEPRPTGLPAPLGRWDSTASTIYPSHSSSAPPQLHTSHRDWPSNLPPLPVPPSLDQSSNPLVPPHASPATHRPYSDPPPQVTNTSQRPPIPPKPSTPDKAREKENRLKWFFKRDRKSSGDSKGSKHTEYGVQNLMGGMDQLRLNGGQRKDRISHSVSTPALATHARDWNGYSTSPGPVINVHVHLPHGYEGQQSSPTNGYMSYTTQAQAYQAQSSSSPIHDVRTYSHDSSTTASPKPHQAQPPQLPTRPVSLPPTLPSPVTKTSRPPPVLAKRPIPALPSSSTPSKPAPPRNHLSPSVSSNLVPQTPPFRRERADTPAGRSDRASPSPSPGPGGGGDKGRAQQCAGYTQKGQRCKRLVKASAPYLSLEGLSAENGARPGGAGDGEEEDMEEKRYCKDHVGKILNGADGFYWRSEDGEARRWVKFSDYVPEDLDEQTRVLLTLTMESPLTSKESPGFIYAYELRDLQTDELSFYKVGRTDNVPRRLDQWTKQCASHTPTPRDIFPLPSSCVRRHPSVIRKPFRSMLPGNMGAGVDERDMCVAVKRLERLIHIELAARSPLPASKLPCPDCSAIHKEIFPIQRAFKIGLGPGGRGGSTEYELTVKEVVMRWDRFVREVIGGEGPE